MSMNHIILLFLTFFNQESYGLDCQDCNGNLPSYLTEQEKVKIKWVSGGLSIADKICTDSENVGTTKTCEPGSVCRYLVIKSNQPFTSKIK